MHIDVNVLHEYEHDYDAEDPDLHQGDILEILPSAVLPGGIPHELGIVITADCDLQHGKHLGVLSYVPVLSAQSYLRMFLLPKLISSSAKEFDKEALKLLDDENRRSAADRMNDMVDLGYPAAKIGALINPGVNRDKFISSIELLLLHRETLKAVLDADNDLQALSLLEQYCSKFDQLKPSKNGKLKSVKASIANGFGKLPDDAYFFCSLSKQREVGYVAMLRSIRELSDSDVARSVGDELRRSGQHSARRISRLTTLHRHKMMQVLASVFFSIGLPDELKTMRELLVESITDAWGK